MDIWTPMSTTARHNEIVTYFVGELFDLVKKKIVNIKHEECSLVYWGNKRNHPSFLNLVNISEIEDIEDFKVSVIEDLYYVQPDFMVFKDNPFIENKRRTRTAGQPDLVVEIWSDSNLKNDRAFLQNLYATSDITEHWYIEQDSNEVICYLGKEKLENQYLTNVLKTRGGLEFDLRYLAI